MKIRGVSRDAAAGRAIMAAVVATSNLAMALVSVAIGHPWWAWLNAVFFVWNTSSSIAYMRGAE